MSDILSNKYSFPHQSIIFTNNELLPDFDMRKAAKAHEIRCEQGSIGTEAAIWEMEIHPTSFCNLRCSGCSYSDRHGSRTIDSARLLGLLRYYSKYDLRSVFVSGGGDPSYWTGWQRVFGQFEHPSFRVGVSTNLANFLQIGRVVNTISFFQIHVVGYDRASAMRETGVDCFDRIKVNLDKLFALRRGEQQITMKVLIKDENYSEVPDFLNFISGYPCDAIVLKLKQNFLENRSEFRPDNVGRLREVALSHPIRSGFDWTLDNLDDKLYRLGDTVPDDCTFAKSGLYRLVTADGLIYPCVASTYERSNACGDLNHLTPLGNSSVRIRPVNCPLQACRHYRCGLAIEEAMDAIDVVESGSGARTISCPDCYEPTLL